MKKNLSIEFELTIPTFAFWMIRLKKPYILLNFSYFVPFKSGFCHCSYTSLRETVNFDQRSGEISFFQPYVLEDWIQSGLYTACDALEQLWETLWVLSMRQSNWLLGSEGKQRFELSSPQRYTQPQDFAENNILLCCLRPPSHSPRSVIWSPECWKS